MKRIITIALSALVLAFSAAAPAEEKAAEVKPEHTWDLTEIYASEEDWNAAREGVLAELENIIAFRGRLGIQALAKGTVEVGADIRHDEDGFASVRLRQP